MTKNTKMRRSDREVGNEAEIWDIIESSDVCRLAFADNGTPYLVTLNFGYSRKGMGILWFHCASEGRKLEMMRRNNLVCFAMDTDHKLYGGEKGCDWGMNFRSVVGYGRLNEAESPAEKNEGLDSIMNHYTGRSGFTYDEKTLSRTTVLKLEITELSAKKRQ